MVTLIRTIIVGLLTKKAKKFRCTICNLVIVRWPRRGGRRFLLVRGLRAPQLWMLHDLLAVGGDGDGGRTRYRHRRR